MSWMVILVLVFSIIPGPQDSAPQQLPAEWQRWLDEDVVYIISDYEREMFLKLKTDEQRQTFREYFWKERDPTPGTVKNEYKIEHYRRIAHANEFFSRDTYRPGWMTDRGRIYITLGPPRNIKNFTGRGALFPSELWTYQSVGKPELPPAFYLLFFKRMNAGEMILYRHEAHSPDDLAGGRPKGDLYNELYHIDSELAKAAYTYLIDETPRRLGVNLSLESLQLVATIDNLRNETDVDTSYIDRIVSGEEAILTEYVFAETPLDHVYSPYVDSAGNCFIDFAIALMPGQVDIGMYNDSYYGALTVRTDLAGTDGTTIVTQEKTYDINWTQAEFEENRHSAQIVLDRIACAPGDYRITTRVYNELSKTYYMITKEVAFAHGEADLVNAGPLNLAASIAMEARDRVSLQPFDLGGGSWLPMPGNRVIPQRLPKLFCQLYLPTELREKGNPVQVHVQLLNSEETILSDTSLEMPISEFNIRGFANVFLTIPPANLAPGPYIVHLTAEIDEYSIERIAQFSIVSSTPPEFIRLIPVNSGGSDTSYALQFADHLSQAGHHAAAANWLRRGLELNPADSELRQQLAHQLLEAGNAAGALEYLEPLLTESPNDQELLYLMARVCRENENYDDAMRYLQRLRYTAGDSPEILNSIAEIHLIRGEPDAARELWLQSLELDPDQQAIREKLELQQ